MGKGRSSPQRDREEQINHEDPHPDKRRPDEPPAALGGVPLDDAFDVIEGYPP